MSPAEQSSAAATKIFLDFLDANRAAHDHEIGLLGSQFIWLSGCVHQLEEARR